MWKFLEVPAVQGAISGAIVALLGTILNNYINVKNTNKIIKNNSENIEKEQKFKEKLEEKKFLREKLEIIAKEILKDNRKIGQIFGEVEKGTKVEEIKLKYKYRKETKNAFLLSLFYFEELHRLLIHYDLKTTRIYRLMNYDLSKEEEDKTLIQAMKDESSEISVDFSENLPIENGRQGVYSEILKQLKIEAKKLIE